jgi:hypothetical protein
MHDLAEVPYKRMDFDSPLRSYFKVLSDRVHPFSKYLVQSVVKLTKYMPVSQLVEAL